MKKSKQSIIHFTEEQKNAIKLGTMERQLLIDTVNKVIAPLRRNKNISHTYISSTSGLGKSFEIKKALRKSNIDFESISGIVSLYAMAAKLAVINHITPKKKIIIIVVDDCDMLLEGTQNVNVIKKRS